ncbi:hypothetical protein C5O23_00300 [Duncaniella muris]|uniref:Exodeoxyribonuclease X-like C-terminal domain-containing protein n=2 Tax=Duncaniella muris TaxID=2094150 RepID=A0A2V1IRK2_9BACT|nr:hypothetical protein [Duncaniella muris]PWB04397.1 hypothetical protein C5O23_00300 [Duncaniella muris]
MYPNDNIFNIYYNIGKRTPFLVKRCELGLARSSSEKRRMDPNKDRTFLVEIVKPRGKYGKAYGKCFVDGKPDDSYRQRRCQNIKDEEIPCAGCGEWVLLDVPGVDMNEIFQNRNPDYVIQFGKYKGKTIKEIYSQDPKYIFWLMEKDHYFRVDFDQLLNIPDNSSDRERIIETEINRVFPKVTPDDVISFGKYQGKTFREIFATDPSYIDWFLRNNQTLDIDINAFDSMMRK